jgi:hypothetical protein
LTAKRCLILTITIYTETGGEKYAEQCAGTNERHFRVLSPRRRLPAYFEKRAAIAPTGAYRIKPDCAGNENAERENSPEGTPIS